MNYVIFPLSPHSPSPPPPGRGGAVLDHHTLVNELQSLVLRVSRSPLSPRLSRHIHYVTKSSILSETLFPFSPSTPRTIRMIYSHFVNWFSRSTFPFSTCSTLCSTITVSSSSSSSSLRESRDLRPRPRCPRHSHRITHGPPLPPRLRSRSLPSFYPSFFEIKKPHHYL